MGSGEAKEGGGNLWNSPAHLRAHRATGRCLVEKIYTKVVQFGLAAWQFGKSRTPCLPPAPCLPTAQNRRFRWNCRQNRRFWAPGGPDGLPTGLLAPKTASRRASWRPRRPPDGPPGAQDGLPTGLLARKTASQRASWRPRRPPDGPPDAPDGLRRAITCRQDHLPTSPPASQVSPGAKRAFDACTFLPLTPYCRDSVLDKTAARRT